MTDRWRAAAVFPIPPTRGIAAIPHLAALLGAQRVVVRPLRRPDDLDVVIGWGEKRNGQIARAMAALHGVPYWRAEDGFVRSVGLGVTGDPPLSIVLDDLGIYYDAREPSRLERLIAEGSDDPALLSRARTVIDRLVASGISKYNDAPMAPITISPARKRVLVVDQTFGDLSIGCGLADAKTFERMLAVARSEHPDAEIVIKTHPDVLAGKKRGYLDAARFGPVRVWSSPTAPAAMFPHVDHVYVVSSQLGFEALLAGKPVTCFGVPWYAGWGLTDDRATGAEAAAAFARRRRDRKLEELVVAAYFRYARYIDPDTGVPCELERVIEHIELQRAMFERNAGKIYCFGFGFWKHPSVRAYLRSPGNKIVFVLGFGPGAEWRGFGPGCRMLVWGQRETPEIRALAERYGVEMWRMEDGFLRSVGLGSDFEEPASLVVDRAGIYYDPSRASELEQILQTQTFSSTELARAKALREHIVATRISKYNVGGDKSVAVPPGRRVILCPGQVEDDASILLGCKDVRTDKGLLTAARASNPEAFIIYKPHPDVLSGNRKGGVPREVAMTICDHIEEEATLAACLDVADEVHTMTSLVGFEALIRGKRVVVHGQPFYSGWGLTEDHNPHPRRTRTLTLDELCVGVLLRYPRYLNRHTGRFTTPEVVIEQLRAERAEGGKDHAIKLGRTRRRARKLVHIVRGVMGGSG
jgi:capsular polysaccharide export protein